MGFPASARPQTNTVNFSVLFARQYNYIKNMIVKKGSLWLLKSKETGKVLGRHKSKKDAVKQEIAIKIAKERAGGK